MLRLKVMALYENANSLLEKLKLDLSVKEEEFVRQSLATRAILSPKLLIKDHKPIKENREFPTRLVIPATNFTATLSKIGYLGIKRCLDKGKVNYSCNYIVQASDLKEKNGGIGVKEKISNDSIGRCDKHIFINGNRDDKKGSEIFRKETHQ